MSTNRVELTVEEWMTVRNLAYFEIEREMAHQLDPNDFTVLYEIMRKAGLNQTQIQHEEELLDR